MIRNKSGCIIKPQGVKLNPHRKALNTQTKDIPVFEVETRFVEPTFKGELKPRKKKKPKGPNTRKNFLW